MDYVHWLESGSDADYVRYPHNLDGEYGVLYGIVLEARESGHRGDTARQLFPVKPTKGERVDLGTGILFFEDISVGLKPLDGRKHDWLNPEALYRLHEQTVELYFDPLPAPVG